MSALPSLAMGIHWAFEPGESLEICRYIASPFDKNLVTIEKIYMYEYIYIIYIYIRLIFQRNSCLDLPPWLISTLPVFSQFFSLVASPQLQCPKHTCIFLGAASFGHGFVFGTLKDDSSMKVYPGDGYLKPNTIHTRLRYCLELGNCLR